MTCLLPHRNLCVSTRCTCLALRPRCPVLIVQNSSVIRFLWSAVVKPKILPVFLMFSASVNHQLSSNSSKLLGDRNTSAIAIWDPIILLYDTLNVSSNNLVHIGVSGASKGESLLFLDAWPQPAFYKWHPVLLVVKVGCHVPTTCTVFSPFVQKGNKGTKRSNPCMWICIHFSSTA